jgi:hypothetical protein
MMEQIRCPACAAPVEAPPGDVLRCKYCGVESRITRSSRIAVPDAPKRSPTVFVAVGVLTVASACAWFLFFSTDEQHSTPPQPAVLASPPSPPLVEAPTIAAAPPPAAPAEIAVEPAPEQNPMADMFSAKPTPGSIRVKWNAKVKKASGRSKRGVACEIIGWVEDNGDSIRPLDVRCKGDLLYSSTQEFSGTADMSTGATVVTAKDGSPHWLLRYNDTGSRSGRPQIRLDSAAHMGRVWSDALPAWDVELTIDPDGVPRPE